MLRWHESKVARLEMSGPVFVIGTARPAMCSVNSAQAANLIEGICQRFALVWLKRELPESPGLKIRSASSPVKPKREESGGVEDSTHGIRVKEPSPICNESEKRFTAQKPNN